MIITTMELYTLILLLVTVVLYVVHRFGICAKWAVSVSQEAYAYHQDETWYGYKVHKMYVTYTSFVLVFSVQLTLH